MFKAMPNCTVLFWQAVPSNVFVLVLCIYSSGPLFYPQFLGKFYHSFTFSRIQTVAETAVSEIGRHQDALEAQRAKRGCGP